VINAATVASLQMQKNRQHYDRSELIAAIIEMP